MLIVTSTVYGKREPMNTNNVENYNERYSPERETYVIKKDGSLEAFHVQKVIDAIGKSAYRALTKFTPEEKEQICECVISHIDALESTQVPISVMHNIVENALEQVRPIVAKSYRDYRNYKQDFVQHPDKVLLIGTISRTLSGCWTMSTKKARRSCMWAIRKIPMQIPHWSPQSAA